MANIRLYYHSDTLKMEVGVNVIIPENTWGHSLADRPEGYRYPVLWLQTGGGFDYTDWARYTAIELYAAEAGIAVVCSGTFCSAYMDTVHGNFQYFSTLSIETPRVVRHLFPLSEKPTDNFLAGFSMGGFGSLKWWVRDPEQFAAIGSFSGVKNIVEMGPALAASPNKAAITDTEVKRVEEDDYMFRSAIGDTKLLEGTENDISYMIQKQMAAGKKFPRAYMATGVEDTHYQDNKYFIEKYQSLGIDVYKTIDHGAHNWEYYDKHVKKYLDWLVAEGKIRPVFSRNQE